MSLGLPENSSNTILGEIFSVRVRLSITFGESKNPTPPTDALTEFFQQEDVISWYLPSMVILQGSSGWKKRCS